MLLRASPSICPCSIYFCPSLSHLDMDNAPRQSSKKLKTASQYSFPATVIASPCPAPSTTNLRLGAGQALYSFSIIGNGTSLSAVPWMNMIGTLMSGTAFMGAASDTLTPVLIPLTMSTHVIMGNSGRPKITPS